MYPACNVLAAGCMYILELNKSSCMFANLIKAQQPLGALVQDEQCHLPLSCQGEMPGQHGVLIWRTDCMYI